MGKAAFRPCKALPVGNAACGQAAETRWKQRGTAGGGGRARARGSNGRRTGGPKGGGVRGRPGVGEGGQRRAPPPGTLPPQPPPCPCGAPDLLAMAFRLLSPGRAAPRGRTALPLPHSSSLLARVGLGLRAGLGSRGLRSLRSRHGLRRLADGLRRGGGLLCLLSQLVLVTQLEILGALLGPHPDRDSAVHGHPVQLRGGGPHRVEQRVPALPACAQHHWLH
mmetsp:Transcript_111872/g.311369  ORF Transcript_111872/g.311369 Transcript_111872/m.311369 type:complete len:222 (-) Transcript_111872:713-1378(-)